MSKVIWYIAKYAIPPSAGSVGTRGFQILRELARMGHRTLMFTSDSNHLVELPSLTTSYKEEEVDGVKVNWIRTLKYRNARSLKRILSWFDFEYRVWRRATKDLEKPDVVIASSLSLLSIFSGIFLRKRYGCLLIIEVRDIWPLVLYEEGGFSPNNPLVYALGWVERLGYVKADRIVGTMPNLGAHVENVLGYPKATFCVPMGVDDELLEKAPTLPIEYAEAYIPNNKFIVCHAGTIGVSNALNTFFECARAMHDIADVHFLIVGEGYMKADYQEQCSDMTNITFAPRVDRMMVQSVLTHCDLLYFSVHPSKVLEYGQSLNKVIDYMLSGRPIVASYSGYPSMINEAQSGSYVPAEDVVALRGEIVRYASMKAEERMKIGSRGREWVLSNRRYKDLAQSYINIIDAPENIQ